MPLRVLYRDELALAVDKPAGWLTVPGRGLGEVLSERVKELAPEALPVHRLDRGTTGVVLFALGPAPHRALNAAFESRRAEKVYLALARGALEGVLLCELPLRAARNGSMRPAHPGEQGAQAAITELRPLERFAGYTWLEARPRTGRTHQIRAHLAAMHLPLAVDERYGQGEPLRAGALDPAAPDPDRPVLTRTPLHAAAIRVPHPRGRGWLAVEAPLPPDLLECLERLRAARRGGAR